MHNEREKQYVQFCLESFRERDCMGNLCVNGRIMFRLNLKDLRFVCVLHLSFCSS